MADTPSRMFGLVSVLILLWVGVYWLYEPRTPARGPAAVTLDPRLPDGPAAEATEPAPLPVPPVHRPVVEPQPRPEPEPVRRDPPAPRTRVVPPEFRSYVVQRGDVSFEAIARRLFNDSRKWEIIARANPFVTSDRLKPGRTVLNIPVDPENIQGRVVVDGGAADAPASAGATAEPPPAASETTYIVQKDDTLWGIAKKVYRRGGAWRVIYDANRDVIRDPDRPTPGAVLRIPPAPAAE